MTYTHHTAPPEDPGTEPAAAELLTLAAKVEAWREGRGLSQNQLCRQIGGLNSKTHGILAKGDLTELRPENHIPKYRAALVEIAEFDSRQELEPVLPDLTPTRLVIDAVRGLKLNKGNDRFLLIEAESGGGKTTAMQYAAGQIPDSIFASASVAWCSPSYGVEQLLTKSGYRGKVPHGLSQRISKLKDRLKEKPAPIFLDEGHHAGLVMLNLFKDLINDTDCWICFGTLHSVWKGIQAARWNEIKQIIHNRMWLRLSLPAPTAQDVEDYLTPRLLLTVPTGKSPESARWDSAFSAVSRAAAGNGLYAYIRKVAYTARLIALRSDRRDKISPDDLFTAAGHVTANTAGFDR
jgi:hypothetical protein